MLPQKISAEKGQKRAPRAFVRLLFISATLFEDVELSLCEVWYSISSSDKSSKKTHTLTQGSGVVGVGIGRVVCLFWGQTPTADQRSLQCIYVNKCAVMRYEMIQSR